MQHSTEDLDHHDAATDSQQAQRVSFETLLAEGVAGTDVEPTPEDVTALRELYADAMRATPKAKLNTVLARRAIFATFHDIRDGEDGISAAIARSARELGAVKQAAIDDAANKPIHGTVH